MNYDSVITGPACINMLAQCRRATQRQLRQSTLHLRHGSRSMVTHEVSRIAFQDVGDSKRLLLELPLSGIAQPGSCRTGSQSIGLGAAPK